MLTQTPLPMQTPMPTLGGNTIALPGLHPGELKIAFFYRTIVSSSSSFLFFFLFWFCFLKEGMGGGGGEGCILCNARNSELNPTKVHHFLTSVLPSDDIIILIISHNSLQNVVKELHISILKKNRQFAHKAPTLN